MSKKKKNITKIDTELFNNDIENEKEHEKMTKQASKRITIRKK